jgi:dephospho-CoA kinase
MSEKIVIGFVGLPGAGKTIALESVLDLGEIATLGNVVRQEADSRNLPHTDENLGMIGKELRQKWGEDIVARRLTEIVKENPAKVIFIDGLRSMFEVEIFRNYWKFPIIAFIVDEELRHKRLMERGREDDSLNVDDLKERDKREIN